MRESISAGALGCPVLFDALPDAGLALELGPSGYRLIMGLRFYRRVKVLPGISLNFSTSGPSLSVGVRGAHVTVGRRGIRKTVGIPGTGIYYTSQHGYHTGVHSDGQGGWLGLIILLAFVTLVAMALVHSR